MKKFLVMLLVLFAVVMFAEKPFEYADVILALMNQDVDLVFDSYETSMFSITDERVVITHPFTPEISSYVLKMNYKPILELMVPDGELAYLFYYQNKSDFLSHALFKNDFKINGQPVKYMYDVMNKKMLEDLDKVWVSPGDYVFLVLVADKDYDPFTSCLDYGGYRYNMELTDSFKTLSVGAKLYCMYYEY